MYELFCEDQIQEVLYESGLDMPEKWSEADPDEALERAAFGLARLVAYHGTLGDNSEMMELFDHEEYGDIMQEEWENIDDKTDIVMALTLATENTLDRAVMSEARALIRSHQKGY